jgi:Carboxypeptidase regulatory-like domain
MEHVMRSVIRAIVLLFLSLASLPVLAQNARISGQVLDPQRAALVGASVTLTNTGTEVNVHTMTGSGGTFLLPPVAPGHYQVTVTSNGFAPSIIDDVILEIGESRTLNIAMKLDSAKTSVNVTAAPPELNTDGADRSLIIEPTFVESIPLNIRNPLQLINFSAGVTKGDDGLSGQDATSESRTNTFRINGAKGSTTDVLIDGAANTTAYYNQDAGIPGVESVQEFRVYTNAYAPEFGRTSGGLVTYALHTGADHFHGSVFEFFRNEDLDGNGFNANHTTPITPRGSFSRNQYGATFGGPVVIPKLYNGRDKTFFYISYEGLRDTQATSFTTTVPTALERTGDFSQTKDAKGNQIVIYDPSTTTVTTTASGGLAYSRTPLNAGTANANKITTPLNPIGAAIVNLYPLPNRAGTTGSDLDNFFSNAPSTDNNNSFDVRIDHQFNAHHSIFGHLTDFTNHINYNDPFGNGLSPEDANDRIPGKNIIVDHTWTIKQNLIFEHHFSWAHSESNRDEAVLKSPASLGFNASNVAPGITANLTPSIGISGPSAVGGYSSLGNEFPYERNYSSVYQYAAATTWVKGKHTVKFGLDLRRYPTQLWDPEQMSVSGGTGFTAGYTTGTTTVLPDSGNGVAELLLGLGSVSSGYEPETQSVHDYAAVYIQDQFRMTRRLLVTYGLRYGYETGDVEKNNLLNYLNTTAISPLQIPSLTLTAGVGIPGLGGTSRQLQNPQKTNFDPRVGVAYNLNDKTVIHAGFGIFHHPAAAWQQFPNADGGIRTTSSVDSEPNGVTPLPGFQLSTPFPVGLTPPQGNAAGLSIDLGDSIEGPLRRQYIPYQENWSLDVQRTLPNDFVVTAAYVGNEGVHLLVNQQLNQLPDSDLALGSKLLTLVPNPLYGLIDPASSINTTTVKNMQLLRPFPQFQNFESNNVGIGHSTYHAGQLTVEHRLKYGLAVVFAYTYSKAIDNVGEQTSVAGTMGAVTDTYCPRCDRSRSDQNETHVLRWSTRYELPFGSQKPFLNQGFIKHVVGGWALSAIYQLDTGRPLALSYTDVANTGSSSTLSRPNVVPGVSDKAPGGPKINLAGTGIYFNKAAFAATPTYSYGTASRYLADVNAPTSWNLDALLEKDTRLSEHLRLGFRIEMFNALNNVIFSGPSTSFTSSTFGEVATLTQSNTPRNIQISARLSF